MRRIVKIIPVSLGEDGFGFDIACAICDKPIEDLTDAWIEWDEDACPAPQAVHKTCAYALNRRIRGRAEWWHFNAATLPAAINYKVRRKRRVKAPQVSASSPRTHAK